MPEQKLNFIIDGCVRFQQHSPWICVMKVCSNGGATYIIGEIIAKDNLNMEN